MAQLNDLLVAGASRLLNGLGVLGTTNSDSILPNTTDTYVLGESGKRWNSAYIKTITGSHISLDTLTVNNYATIGGGQAATAINTGALRIKGGLSTEQNSFFGKSIILTPAASQGIKIGTAYITAASSTNGEIVLQGGHLRFGGSDWAYDNWAGLKYDHSSKTMYLGIADGSIFTANTAQSGGTLALPGVRYLSINGKTVIDAVDGWLRINETKAYATGVYFGNNVVRTDGQLQVGSSGTNFYANSSGNGYFSNTLGIAGTNTSYKLYVNGKTRVGDGAASTSTTTGGLIVGGGIGVSGDSYFGGNITASVYSGQAEGHRLGYRHLDAGNPNSWNDSRLYIGYGSMYPTRSIGFYNTNSANTGNTLWAEVNDNGFYARTRFGVNGQSTNYHFYVNGSSYLSGTLSLASTTPIVFYGNGTGTYNQSAIYVNSTSFTIETPRATDSGSATILPFLVKTRGGEDAPLRAGKINAGDKVELWTDSEGGNIRLTSPNGSLWSIDALGNTSMRFIWAETSIPFSFSNDGTISGNRFTGHANSAMYLYADNSPYRYGDSAPYYAHMTYNTNGDYRWYLRVAPETPKDVAVDYSYDSGKLGGNTKAQLTTYSTQRDFANGTLIYTDINYANNEGDPFYMEIRGNTYGRTNSCFTQVQGYIYSGTVINYGVMHLGHSHIDSIICMNLGGNLCFWFPRHGYWEGYSIFCSTGYNYSVNRVTSVTNSADPGGTKRVNLSSNVKYTWKNGMAVTGAVWNDYAEHREADTEEFGYVLMETGKDSLTKTTERLSHFAGVSSDTWGFSQGETDKAKTPIAVAGRVLVYPYQDRNNYKPGDCVCAAPGGTVDIMTREEVVLWPDRVVGTVSQVPDYEEWGGGENADRPAVKVDGRIWIKVR